jgi:hypothetical protein
MFAAAEVLCVCLDMNHQFCRRVISLLCRFSKKKFQKEKEKEGEGVVYVVVVKRH